jgi:hypothetical protein
MCATGVTPCREPHRFIQFTQRLGVVALTHRTECDDEVQLDPALHGFRRVAGDRISRSRRRARAKFRVLQRSPAERKCAFR